MHGVALVALGLSVLVACDGRDVDESVAATPRGRLEVDLERGDGLRPDPGSLVVQSHDANEVRIVSESSEWGASGVRMRLDGSGDTVRLIGRVKGMTSFMFGGPRIEVRIFVPREYSLDLRCSGGAVRVDDVTGSVRVRTDASAVEIARTVGDVRVRSEGNVRLTEIEGLVDVRIDGGDIEASWIQGDTELRTGGGEIDVSHVEGALVARSARGGLQVRDLTGPVEAVTERGTILASFRGDPEGRIETSRGSVEVLLPETASAELDAVSRRGTVKIAEGFRVPGKHEGSRVRGPLNGGGAPLRVFTARGSVQVRAR